MVVTVRPLQERDLADADHIFRLAFGTFIGLGDPMSFAGDADWVRSRWRTAPHAALAAEVDGEFAGSNFLTNWGSVGFFGPLTVHPKLWQQGVAKQLLESTMELFGRWGMRHLGLYTFADSPKHISLYQRFGFWPRFLTAVMSKPVRCPSRRIRWSTYSDAVVAQRDGLRQRCDALTDSVFAGLSVEREIRGVAAQKLGDTVLLWNGDDLRGFAVCHCGAGSEAGSGACYVKFGVAQPGPGAAEHFDDLLDACEGFAAAAGIERIVAGVNTGRAAAYRRMLERGFRTDIQGVAMQQPNEAGYHRGDVFAIDDWR